jgi:hypothetical protein
MPSTLALIWQASGDTTLYILVGAIVLCLIVLGLKFLRAMFEVITAPQASLGHHGRSDGFFHSMIIVLLAGLITALIVHVRTEDLRATWQASSQAEASAIAAGAANRIYADVIESSSKDKLDANFENFFVGNIIFIPLILLGYWFVLSILAFLFSRMLGGQCTLGGVAGALAYAYFFGFIAQGLTMDTQIGSFLGSLSGTPPGSPAMSPLVIVGMILSLYSAILWFMALSQGGDLTVGQIIGVTIFIAVIVGGSTGYAMYKGKEAYTAWTTKMKAYNPAIGGGGGT